MTDIHTHILPGMDDGADTVEESIRLLKAELDDGVDTVALTPHFRADIESIRSFVERRRQSHKLLSDAAYYSGIDIGMKLGAEVAFSAQLAQMESSDIDKLCYEGTRTILIELPTEHYPPFTRRVMSDIRKKHYRPMIAHVERCSSFTRNPQLLEALVQDGVLMQVTADSVLHFGELRRRVMTWIREGLVHVLASDTHGMDMRPPVLSKAVEYVMKKTGKDLSAR